MIALGALGIVFGQLTYAQSLTQALCPAGSNFDLLPFGLAPATAATGMGHIPLLKHSIELQTYPDARCNDGSPAVMYIRPANAVYAGNPITDASSKWLIFFEGGGGCRDADSCLRRWCGGGPHVFDRAAKMSSLGTWLAIRSPNGIFNINPAVSNNFTDYNHVYVYYCSSDNGIGSARISGINASNGSSYDIQFQGEAIVNAVFETLFAGPTSANPIPTEHYYDTALPDLEDATEILIAGESAGGGIVRHHIDRLREDFLEPRIPGVVVRAIVDAGAPPGQWDPTIDWSDPSSPSDYRDMLLTVQEPTVRSFWGANDSALDQSCLNPIYTAEHDLVGSHPQVCYDTTYTLLNHIKTPVFLRMDIDDPLGQERYLNWNLYDIDGYWQALFDQLGVLQLAGGLEQPLAAPGIQGPNCERHVATTNEVGFYMSRVASNNFVPLPYHDLVVNWLNGLPLGSDTIQIQDDNLGAVLYTQSNFCW